MRIWSIQNSKSGRTVQVTISGGIHFEFRGSWRNWSELKLTRQAIAMARVRLGYTD
jgi:hypothetical protein